MRALLAVALVCLLFGLMGHSGPQGSLEPKGGTASNFEWYRFAMSTGTATGATCMRGQSGQASTVSCGDTSSWRLVPVPDGETLIITDLICASVTVGGVMASGKYGYVIARTQKDASGASVETFNFSHATPFFIRYDPGELGNGTIKSADQAGPVTGAATGFRLIQAFVEATYATPGSTWPGMNCVIRAGW